MPPQQEQARLYPWEEIDQEHTKQAILITEQHHTCLHKHQAEDTLLILGLSPNSGLKEQPYR